MSSKMKQMVGKVVSIRKRQTAKGEALAYTLLTAKGNRIWFQVWGDNTTSQFIAQRTTHVPDLSSVHFEDQELAIEGEVSEEKPIDKEPGKIMVFIKPNPKLVRASPPTAEMRARAEYERKLDALDNKRLGGALVVFHEGYSDRVEPRDVEFLGSLAAGAKQYKSVSDKQRPYVVPLLAKYAMRVAGWRKTVDESLAKGDFDDGAEPGDDAPGGAPEDADY